MMADIPDYDPTKDDTGAAGGARGGGDDDAQDLSFPGVPTDPPDEQRRRRWPGGARPKTKGSYEQLPQDDKDTPMTTFPKKQSGLPSTSNGTAETSFIEGMPEGRVQDPASLKIALANERLEQQYPNYGKDGKLLTLKVVAGKVGVVGPQLGFTNLYLADNETLYPQLRKLKFARKNLGPPRTELVQQNGQEIQQKAQQREELTKTIEEDTKIAEDENEQPSVRDQASQEEA